MHATFVLQTNCLRAFTRSLATPKSLCTRREAARRGLTFSRALSSRTSNRTDVYTHGHAPSVVKSHGLRSAESCAAYLLAKSHVWADGNARVLDVGCGPGSITVGLAKRSSRVDAIDTSDQVLELAVKTVADANLPDRVFLQNASVYELPFEDDTFDIVHAHQVLQHLGDPVAALREMRRVAKNGSGVVAVRDADYSSFLTFPVVDEIEKWRALYREVCYRNKAEPDAGRSLLSWVRQAGFEKEGENDPVELTMAVVAYTTRDECVEWGDSWKLRALESDFNRQAKAYGLASQEELEAISAAWARWARMDHACFYYVNGQIIAQC